jgi:hypothetical protein
MYRKMYIGLQRNSCALSSRQLPAGRVKMVKLFLYTPKRHMVELR